MSRTTRFNLPLTFAQNISLADGSVIRLRVESTQRDFAPNARACLDKVVMREELCVLADLGGTSVLMERRYDTMTDNYNVRMKMGLFASGNHGGATEAALKDLVTEIYTPIFQEIGFLAATEKLKGMDQDTLRSIVTTVIISEYERLQRRQNAKDFQRVLRESGEGCIEVPAPPQQPRTYKENEGIW